MTLHASRRDYALQPSQWLRLGLARLASLRPLISILFWSPVETVDVSAVNTKYLWGLFQGHSYAGDRPAILDDMFQLLQFAKSTNNVLAPRRRFSTTYLIGS